MCKTLGSLLLMCVACPLMALPEDSHAVIYVQAGSAILTQKTHRGTYKGGITIDQGSTHIRATSAITQGNGSNQLIKAMISGDLHNQVHYWALPAQDKPMVHAYADTIVYYPLTQEIELIGHARVEQGKHAFTAAVIHYNIKTQHVGTKPIAGEQTTFIIQPDKTL
jgi:lipopolysaccharide export system protein LptA